MAASVAELARSNLCHFGQSARQRFPAASSLRSQNPTSRKERKKWGTRVSITITASSWEATLIARMLAVVLLLGSALAQNVVHYTTTVANVKYLFATAEPVLRLKSGDILDTNTLDCFGNGLKKPGDTLAVKILDLQVDGDTGVGAFAPGFGAINETNYTPMLHAPLPEKVWIYPINHADNTATARAASA